MLECAANLACVGAEPLGTTNNLNFGNPEKPHIAWQLTESVRGLGDACRALAAPIVGGNVSLYNEGATGPIYPTPVIGMVGRLPDARRAGPARLRRAPAIRSRSSARSRPSLAASELAKLLRRAAARRAARDRHRRRRRRAARSSATPCARACSPAPTTSPRAGSRSRSPSAAWPGRLGAEVELTAARCAGRWRSAPPCSARAPAGSSSAARRRAARAGRAGVGARPHDRHASAASALSRSAIAGADVTLTVASSR